MTDLTRYFVPDGVGAQPHPCGLLYSKPEVDARIEALEAQLKSAEQAARYETDVAQDAIDELRKLQAQLKAADELVSKVQLLRLREIVAGWNGEECVRPYVPHDSNIPANIPTTAGCVYEIDSATEAYRKARGQT